MNEITVTERSAERRIQSRCLVDLPVKVYKIGQAITAYRARNICSGGLLLEPESAVDFLSFQQGDQLEVRIDFLDLKNNESLQAVIEVRHCEKRSIGARFIVLKENGRICLDQFIEKLNKKNQNNVNSVQKSLNKKAQKILQQVGHKHLGGLIESLFENLIDELWRHTERASNDQYRLQLIGEVSQLARATQEEHLSLKLFEEIYGSLQQFAMGFTQTPKRSMQGSEISNLQLIDPDEFEIWLAKSQAANRLEQELSDSLSALRIQVDTLFQGEALPLEPLALTDAIEQTMRGIGLGTRVQCLAFQIITRHLARNLGSFYREILWAWERAGLTNSAIQPRLTNIPVMASPVSSGLDLTSELVREIQDEKNQVVPTLENPGFANSDSELPASSALENRILEISSQIVEQSINRLSEGLTTQLANRLRQTNEKKQLANLEHVSSALASLPSGYQIPFFNTRAPLKELVLQWLQRLNKTGTSEQQSFSALTPQLEERVTATDHLLSHMLNDSTTPPRLKSLIKLFSTHFLTMAVKEPGFITDSQQPLMKFFDRLEYLMQLSSLEENENQEIRTEIERIVHALVTNRAINQENIDRFSNQLGVLEKRVGQESKINIANWIEVCESRERLRVAREEVRNRFNSTFFEQRMHKILNEILQAGWLTLLESIGANKGFDSSRWQEIWQDLLLLHQLTSSTDFCNKKPKLEQNLLLNNLRIGLIYIGTDQLTCEEIINRVEIVLQKVAAGLVSAEDYLVFILMESYPESLPELLPQDLVSVDWERCLIQVDQLNLGTILRIKTKDSERMLRIIWRNAEGTHLAVTDVLGKKLKVIRRGWLAEILVRGQAVIQDALGRRFTSRATEATLTEFQQGIENYAVHDVLTGLANQRQLIGKLTKCLINHAQKKLYILCILELDRYDNLTATYGFALGEQMLQSVAKLLKGVLPDALCLAYLGGSRFGFISIVTDRIHATEIGESTRIGFNGITFNSNGKKIQVSSSLGLVLFPDEQTTPEQLMSAANLACLAAQREGGDQILLFQKDHVMIARQVDQMRSWAQAKEVIKAGRKRLRYQRIVPIDTDAGLSPHCEILLSVYDEQGTPLPLQSFIEAAESFNMMREVDRQVINETFQWIHSSPETVRIMGGVAINLSGQSLNDNKLPAEIRAGLEEMQIPVELISFEVTETAAIVNLSQAKMILDEIKSLGCHIALDDFGAGLSSYNYLKQLPIDYVKIDGSFVKEMLVSPHDCEIVKSINNIAHFLGKKTIAEYVENPEMLKVLGELGVDYAQGYAIEKPKFIDELQII